MNRIQKYQESVERFLKNKTHDIIDNNSINVISSLLRNNNYLMAIFLLTISNNTNKKNKIQQHGYYIGCSMELLFLLLKITEKKIKINNTYVLLLMSLINIMLVNNIELSTGLFTKEKNIKNYNSSIKLLNTKIIEINNNYNFKNNNFLMSDLFNYKFKDPEKIKNKIKLSNKINKEELIKYIEDKYCNIIKFACGLTWNLGGGNENSAKYIQKLGYYYGILLKFNVDLEDIESEIMQDNKINNSYPSLIINLGIQQSFEFFFDIKQKFIELSIKLGLYNSIVKEIIDFIENRFDIFLANTVLDIREEYEI
jgi:hypothetical protein